MPETPEPLFVVIERIQREEIDMLMKAGWDLADAMDQVMRGGHQVMRRQMQMSIKKQIERGFSKYILEFLLNNASTKTLERLRELIC